MGSSQSWTVRCHPWSTFLLATGQFLRITTKYRVGDRKDIGLTPAIRPCSQDKAGRQAVRLSGHSSPWATNRRPRQPDLLLRSEAQVGGGQSRSSLLVTDALGLARTSSVAARLAALWHHPTNCPLPYRGQK